MSKNLKEIEKKDKLPNNSVDLSVAGNLEAARDKHETLLGNKRKKKEKAKGSIVCRIRHGRPYWYLIIKIKVNGKWKNKETYIGTRKPRS